MFATISLSRGQHFVIYLGKPSAQTSTESSVFRSEAKEGRGTRDREAIRPRLHRRASGPTRTNETKTWDGDSGRERERETMGSVGEREREQATNRKRDCHMGQAEATVIRFRSS